jgi:hypothetical protein
MFSTRAIAPFIGCFEINKAQALARHTAANKKKKIVENILTCLQKLFHIRYEFFTRVVHKRSFSRVHSQGICRASLHAKPAKHASQIIYFKANRLFLYLPVWGFTGIYPYAAGRAGGSAHSAGNAAGRAICSFKQAMHSAIVFGYGCFYGWVWNGGQGFVPEKTPQKMPQRGE